MLTSDSTLIPWLLLPGEKGDGISLWRGGRRGLLSAIGAYLRRTSRSSVPSGARRFTTSGMRPGNVWQAQAMQGS